MYGPRHTGFVRTVETSVSGSCIARSGGHFTVGTRSWSRYVQMCASYLTIQRTTLVGAFEICFRTLVYEQLETRETLTLTPTGNCLNLSTGTQVVHCTVSLQTHICTYLDHDLHTQKRHRPVRLLQPVAPSGLIQVWYHSCIILLSPTDCSEPTVSDWNSLLSCQGCISPM